MHPRFFSFAQAFKSSRQWSRLGQSGQLPRIAPFLCQTCRYKVSASSLSQKIAQFSRRTINTAAKNGKEKRYPSELLIYDSGDTRTTFVAFWKAVAFLQFGTCVIFLTPILYKNENQPNEYIRWAQAAGVTAAAAIPSLILSYITAPYVNQVYLQIPPSASHSLTALRAFARNLPPTARIRFLTLRIFPIGKFTTNYLFELRALPPRKLRFANIEMAKTEAWRKRQREKGMWRRFKEFVKEPRYKFYVKEGRRFTVRSGVPGVWEEVAKKIQEQTVRDVSGKGGKKIATGKLLRPVTPVKVAESEERARMVKRQTSRASMK